MKNRIASTLKIAGSIAVLATTMSVFGFACSEGFQSKSMQNVSDLGSQTPPGGGTQGPVVSGLLTVGVPILAQSYASVAGALQVAAPSTQSRDEFNRQSGNFSDSGQPTSVGSAFVLSFATLGAQLCQDRIAFETVAANAAAKVLFNSINLGAAPANNVSDANLAIVINRIARAVWQRNETQAERDILTVAVKESMALDAVENATKTQEAALFLCSAMVSSMSGLQQ